MNRRLGVLLGLAVVLVVGYMATSTWLGEGRRAAPAPQGDSRAGQVQTSGPSATNPQTAGEYEQMLVKVALPAQGVPLPAPLSGKGGSCPMSGVSSLLGIEITRPHGIIVGRVLPEASAGKAGLQTGDSIIELGGEPVTCPSRLLPLLDRDPEPREVELTIRRPKTAASTQEEPATEDATSPERPEGAMDGSDSS